MNQRTYIIIGLVLIIVALVVAVLVWALLLRAGTELQRIAEPAREAIPALQEAWQGVTGEAAPFAPSNNTPTETPATPTPNPTPSDRPDIPLASLALTAEQRALAENFGITVDSFVITGAMQVCAEETLGAERFAAVVAGEAPGFMEATRLLRCISPQ